MAKIFDCKKNVIKALFSDDDLMNTFVLKGGNALNIAYAINDRASVDIDISMENDFKDIEGVRKKLEVALKKTFADEKIEVFDVELKPRPLKINIQETKTFWGGYRLTFKLIESDKYKQSKNALESIRREALIVDQNNRKVFKVDISKYEFCKEKTEVDLEGILIYVYTPTMIVYEKLRAICQQMDDYRKIFFSTKTARAKDFFDIYTTVIAYKTSINLYDSNNLDMLREIFEIKKVDLTLLGKIKEPGVREFHRDSFNAVENTVSPDKEIKEYDFYFDFVVEIAEELLKQLFPPD